MRRYALILSGLLCSVLAMAQEVSINGKVLDKSTGETLPGVNVYTNIQRGTISNADGSFSLLTPPGTYTLKFRFIGYRDTSFQITTSGSVMKLPDIYLSPRQTELKTVVVTANRYAQDLSDLSVSASVLKPKLIEEKNTRSIEESLQQVPGVVILDNEPQIRSGSGFSFGAGSRVLVMVDDLPILSGDIGRPTWGFLPIENISQVEILKGASSVLYGSAALSGVINLRTAFPTDTPQTRINVFNGVYSAPRSDNNLYWRDPNYQHVIKQFRPLQNVVANPMTGGLSAFHSQRFGHWDLVVAGNTQYDMGYIGPYYHHDKNGKPINYSLKAPGDTSWDNGQQYDNRVRFNTNVRYRFPGKDGAYAGVNFNVLEGNSANTLLWYSLDSGLYRPGNGALTRTRQFAYNIDPYIEWKNPQGISQKLKTRLFHLNNNNSNGQSNKSDTFYGDYQLQQVFEKGPFQGLRITAGLSSTITSSQATLFSGNEKGSDHNSATNAAVYTDVGYEFFGRLKVNAGLRYERYRVDQFNQSATIFRAGLNYHLTEGTALRASFGQGFRFPTIGERYIRTAVGSYNIFPNENLNPEHSYSTELGIHQGYKLGKVLGYIDVAGFYQHYSNYIEFTFGQWGSHYDQVINYNGQLLYVVNNPIENFGFKSVNTGLAEVHGIDLTIAGRWKSGKKELTWTLGYTYTVPKTLTPDQVYAEQSFLTTPAQRGVTYRNTSSDLKNNILKYRFQHLVKADVSYTYKRWMIGASLRYNSHMQNIDAVFVNLDEQGIIPTGVSKWRAEHTKGDLVIDLRGSYGFTKHSTIGIAISNLLNNEYALRPLSIESPRLTIIRYTYSLPQ